MARTAGPEGRAGSSTLAWLSHSRGGNPSGKTAPFSSESSLASLSTDKWPGGGGWGAVSEEQGWGLAGGLARGRWGYINLYDYVCGPYVCKALLHPLGHAGPTRQYPHFTGESPRLREVS